MQLMLAVWDREREHGDKLQEGLQEIMVPYFTHQDFGKLNSLWAGPHTQKLLTYDTLMKHCMVPNMQKTTTQANQNDLAIPTKNYFTEHDLSCSMTVAFHCQTGFSEFINEVSDCFLENELSLGWGQEIWQDSPQSLWESSSEAKGMWESTDWRWTSPACGTKGSWGGGTPLLQSQTVFVANVLFQQNYH